MNPSLGSLVPLAAALALTALTACGDDNKKKTDTHADTAGDTTADTAGDTTADTAGDTTADTTPGDTTADTTPGDTAEDTADTTDTVGDTTPPEPGIMLRA